MRYCGHFLIKAEGGAKNYKRDHPLRLSWRPFTVVFLQRKGYRYRTPDIGTQMSDIGTQMSDIGTRMLDKDTRMSDIGTRMSDIDIGRRIHIWDLLSSLDLKYGCDFEAQPSQLRPIDWRTVM